MAQGHPKEKTRFLFFFETNCFFSRQAVFLVIMAQPRVPSKKWIRSARNRFNETEKGIINRHPEAFYLKGPVSFSNLDTSISQAASSKKINRFGRPFVGALRPLEIKSGTTHFLVRLGPTDYESPLGFVIDRLDLSTGNTVTIGSVKLGFDRGTVCLEGVQGTAGEIRALKKFEAAVRLPWPNFLIKKIEATAKRLGYQKIAFRDFESFHYYEQPHITSSKADKWYAQQVNKSKDSWPRMKPVNKWLLSKQKIQSNMRRLYTHLYAVLGYSQKDGKYFVKPLR